MCTAHHIGICPLNVRPPKTRSREEVESRQRRLGRIDSFSPGASAEPFPGWRLAGGAAAGEQRWGPEPTSLGFPAPAEHNGAPLAAAPSSRLSFAAPAASGSRRRRMNESENPAPRGPPAPSPQAPGGRALRREARGERRGEARGSSEARQPRLVPPPRLVSPAPRCLTFPGPPLPPHTPPSAAASAAPGGLAPVAASDSTERAPNRAQPRAPLPGSAPPA